MARTLFKMENSCPSTIAEFCAAIRATHFLHGDRPLIIEDPVAIELINSDLHKICHSGIDLAKNGGASIVIGRARYTEDLHSASPLSVSSRSNRPAGRPACPAPHRRAGRSLAIQGRSDVTHERPRRKGLPQKRSFVGVTIVVYLCPGVSGHIQHLEPGANLLEPFI